jgi:hypothetical protein
MRVTKQITTSAVSVKYQVVLELPLKRRATRAVW